MKPDQDKNTWQQPSEQPTQAPYIPHAEDETPKPVVTLTPDQPSEPSPGADPTPGEGQQPEPPVDDQAPVRWEAAEYIQRDKSAWWFVVFAVVVVVLMALAIFIMQSVTFAILIPVMAAALLVYNYRSPRIINYTLSRKGLYVNDHLYPFKDFKSFGVIHEDDEYSIMLIPVKRFKPGVSVYFPEESGEAIVDMLGVRLPMKEVKLDAVDKILRKLRI